LFMTHTRGDVLMSGGGAGPEGSLLGLPAQAIGLFVFLWAVKRAGLFLRGWDGPGAPAQAPVTQSLPDE